MCLHYSKNLKLGFLVPPGTQISQHFKETAAKGETNLVSQGEDWGGGRELVLAGTAPKSPSSMAHKLKALVIKGKEFYIFCKSIIIIVCEENGAPTCWIWSQCDSEMGKSLLQLFHCIRAISFTSLGEAFTFLWDPCCITSCPATETDMVWAVSLNPLCSQLCSNVGKRKTWKQL